MILIRNIIFDIGNVLLNFKPEAFLRRFTRDENRIKEFTAKVIKTELWLSLDRGDVSLKDAQNEYLKRYPEESDLLKVFFNHWKEILTLIPQNIQILRDLKTNNYKIYILSNFIREAFTYVTEQFDFFELIDGKVISYVIKSIKPEDKIFQTLIEKYRLKPEQCVFIDDEEVNISKAKSIKMKTIHYLEGMDLRFELRNMNIAI